MSTQVCRNPLGSSGGMMIFDHLTDAQLFALCIYGEARGEPVAGKIAVGSVVLERVRRNGWFGKDLKSVLLKPYQFSCFLPSDKNFKRLEDFAADFDTAMAMNPVLNSCYVLATGLLEGRITPNVEATHYEALSTDEPAWTKKLHKV